MGLRELTTTYTGRGTLQPAKSAEGSVKCELCGCRWIPDETSFGCPGCEMMESFKDFYVHDPA